MWVEVRIQYNEMRKSVPPIAIILFYSIILFIHTSCSGDAIVPIEDPNSGEIPGEPHNTPTETGILAADYIQNLDKGFDVTWSEFTKFMELYNEQVVIDFKAAGFTNVRIRIGDDIVDQQLMDRLKEQVHDCLRHGIYPIIAYQGHYLEDLATSDEDAKTHLVNWWKNIAEEFKGDSDMLAFDILVEISGAYKTDYQFINSAYADVLAVIRETNPTRIVIFPPVNLSNPNYLQYLEVPGTDDPYTLVEWHFYAAGPSKDPSNKKYWLDGSTLQERKNITDPIRTAVDWMQKTGYKTWVGAWMAGNYNKGNEYTLPEQVMFASFMVRELAKEHIPWSVNAGNKYYDYENQTWYTKTADAAGMPVRDVILDPDKIAIYPEDNYEGNPVRMAPGNYDSQQLQGLQIKSLMIPFDYQVKLYSESGFKGTEKIVNTTSENLDNFTVNSLKVLNLNSY